MRACVKTSECRNARQLSILAGEKIVDATRHSRLDGFVKTKTCLLSCTLALAAVAICWAGDPKIEQALRDLDAQWSAAATAKDVDKTVAYYSNDAVVLPPNAQIATTKDAIRNVWKGFLTTPGVALSWKASKVEVAKSGELGYVSGTYEATTDAGGKSLKENGKYVEILKKQPDGTWKCVVDIWNPDSPATSQK